MRNIPFDPPLDGINMTVYITLYFESHFRRVWSMKSTQSKDLHNEQKMYLIRTRHYSTAIPSKKKKKMHTMKTTMDKRIQQHPMQNPRADSLELCSSLNSELNFYPVHHPMPGQTTRPVQKGNSAHVLFWPMKTFQSKYTHPFYHK